MSNLSSLPSHDEKGNLRVVIETPRGSRAKLKYEASEGIFKYGRPLVLGVSYPYDWGFIPRTCAPDGDPLDVMVLHEIATFPGIVIACRPIGVVRVTQNKASGDAREHNDRVIAVPENDPRVDDVSRLEERVRKELEQFFVLATLMTKKDVKIEGWDGPQAATRLIKEAEAAYAKSKK